MAHQTKKKKTANEKPGAKVIALNTTDEQDTSQQTILQQAAGAEKNGDLESAEKLYKKQLQQKAFNAAVYTRLMIVFRKQKKYKEELEIIDKGLKHYQEHQAKKSEKKASNAAIQKLSKSLNKSLGLTDKKGNSIYEPEPIPTWKKRRITVQKKFKK